MSPLQGEGDVPPPERDGKKHQSEGNNNAEVQNEGNKDKSV